MVPEVEEDGAVKILRERGWRVGEEVPDGTGVGRRDQASISGTCVAVTVAVVVLLVVTAEIALVVVVVTGAERQTDFEREEEESESMSNALARLKYPAESAQRWIGKAKS